MLKDTALLRLWSYHYGLPQKNKNKLFSISCVHVGIKFASNRLRVCLFSVWYVGCATANRRLCFNHLTSCSIRFNSRSYASLPGETTSVLNRHAEARSWKRAPRWWILSKKKGKKKTHQNFQEEYYPEKFLCIVRSTWSAKHVKCSTCFFCSWDFYVTHGGMYNIEQRVNSKHHIIKGKVIGSTLKIPH